MTMQGFKEYLLFKKFMMPYAFQILFWSGIGGTLYGSWWLYKNDNWAWVLALVFGSILTRLIFESFILKYQIYLSLNEIKENIKGKGIEKENEKQNEKL